jgi:hypothetical protein
MEVVPARQRYVGVVDGQVGLLVWTSLLVESADRMAHFVCNNSNVITAWRRNGNALEGGGSASIHLYSFGRDV